MKCFLIILLISNSIFAQSDSFYTYINSNKNLNWDTVPIITIPVVVSIAWHEDKENLDDLIIENSIKLLTEDFRCYNSDKLNDVHPFYKFMADTKINFKLILIQRVWTDTVEFINPYNSRKLKYMHAHSGEFYYNIYIGNFGRRSSAVCPYQKHLLRDIPDGISIDYKDFDKQYCNRILTHETGHWLGLFHTFGTLMNNLTETLNGDYGCGDDYIDDTPPQTYAVLGCPKFPVDANNICGSDSNGVMYMNYMDYTHPCCQCMFTKGQAERMRAVLNTYRKNLRYKE